MSEAAPRASGLALIVLAMLCEQPMHPYAMHQLIRARGKDRVVNVRSRASLYQVIHRLARDGLLEVAETMRSDRAPDRIVYRITDAGRDVARTWLGALLASFGTEFPDFLAGLSVVSMLSPDQAREHLQRRADSVAAELADTTAVLRRNRSLPRVVLLEEGYRQALLRAELSWLRGTIAAIEDGSLTWSHEQLLAIAADSAATTTEESIDDCALRRAPGPHS